MTVDGKQSMTERWKTVGLFNHLSSSRLYLAGTDPTVSLPGADNINNLVGCLKKVSTSILSTPIYGGNKPLQKITKTENNLRSLKFVFFQQGRKICI